MEPLINLKSSMSDIVSDVGWLFSMTVLFGAIVMILIDYFNNKLK
jgi:hypothetical protein